MPKAIIKKKSNTHVAHPVAVFGLHKGPTPKIKLVVDLNVLIRRGYTDKIEFVTADNQITAVIHLENNELTVTGTGKTVPKAIRDLSENIVKMNFEL